MPKPDFSNDTSRLAARTRTLRALNAETSEDADTIRTKSGVTTVELQPVVPRQQAQHPKPVHEQQTAPTRLSTSPRWSNRMASLNTEIPFDMRELIDELYVTRRKIDKREGRKLTTYADLTTEAFDLLLQQTLSAGPHSEPE